MAVATGTCDYCGKDIGDPSLTVDLWGTCIDENTPTLYEYCEDCCQRVLNRVLRVLTKRGKAKT